MRRGSNRKDYEKKQPGLAGRAQVWEETVTQMRSSNTSRRATNVLVALAGTRIARCVQHFVPKRRLKQKKFRILIRYVCTIDRAILVDARSASIRQ
jgi:hypothetical protein